MDEWHIDFRKLLQGLRFGRSCEQMEILFAQVSTPRQLRCALDLQSIVDRRTFRGSRDHGTASAASILAVANYENVSAIRVADRSRQLHGDRRPEKHHSEASEVSRPEDTVFGTDWQPKPVIWLPRSMRGDLVAG